MILFDNVDRIPGKYFCEISWCSSFHEFSRLHLKNVIFIRRSKVRNERGKTREREREREKEEEKKLLVQEAKLDFSS